MEDDSKAWEYVKEICLKLEGISFEEQIGEISQKLGQPKCQESFLDKEEKKPQHYPMDKKLKIEGSCYKKCNKNYGMLDPFRLYCKKGCDAQEQDIKKCEQQKCHSVCIRSELGDEGSKLGKWSTYFSRAPKDPQKCLQACNLGCFYRVPEGQSGS